MFTTKVVTLAKDGDKYQYFHHHENFGDVMVVDSGAVLRVVESSTKTVSYPLVNVERFETEKQNGRR